MNDTSGEQHLNRLSLISRMVVFIAIAGLIASFAALPFVGGLGLATRNSVRGFQGLPSDLTQVALPQQNVITDIHGQEIATLYSQNRIEIPLDQISPLMQQAIISIEDQRFLQHAGIDIKGTLRALVSTGSGHQVQGGSTITQQYVKQILLTAATSKADQQAAVAVSINRKIREARYAIALENKLSKRQILEGYLNIAYFGAGSYGVEVAARRYFSSHASDLSLTQAATLAGLVQNPSRYDPTRYPEIATLRRDEVLNAMARAGYITDAAATEAKKVKLSDDLKPATLANGCTSSIAPFFCDYVTTILKQEPAFGETPEARQRLLDIGGLTITTTLDLKAQKAAQKAVNNQIPPKDPSQKAAAITMIRPGTGEIVAMAQNREWGRSGAGKTAVNYNVPQAQNGTVGFQAGSTFKAFTMAAALKQGFDPFEIIPAPPKKTFKDFKECQTGAAFPPYDVKNSTHSGAFNMLSGAAFSVNTYFVGLEERIGLCGPTAMAKATGLTQGNGQDIPAYPCFTLGCFDVTTLGMANSMATFAAHGINCKTIAISRVVDRYKKDLQVPAADCKRTVDVQVADSVSAILAGVIDGPISGRTGQAMSFGRDAAGKTGTTDSSAAVWFVGYTPDLAAAVWVGDPRGGQQHPMKNITINGRFYSQVFGSLMPGPIWRESMKGALAGSPEVPWNLTTLHGLNAGGFGNDSGIKTLSCKYMTGQDKTDCEAKKAKKAADKAAAAAAAAGATASPKPKPSPSSS